MHGVAVRCSCGTGSVRSGSSMRRASCSRFFSVDGVVLAVMMSTLGSPLNVAGAEFEDLCCVTFQREVSREGRAIES